MRDQGDNLLSRRYLEETLALQQQVGDTAAMGYTIYTLGYSAQVAGDDAQAGALYTQSLHLARQGGDQWSAFWNVLQLANLQWRAGHADHAQRLYKESLALATELDYQPARAQALAGLAQVALAGGHTAAARALFEQSQRIYHALHAAGEAARVELGLGWLSLPEGDPGAARRYFRAALEAAAARGMHLTILRGLRGLASLEARGAGSAPLVRAARLWSAIGAQAALRGLVLPDPYERSAYAELEQVLTRALPAAARQHALAAGQALSLETAVAAALA